MALNLNQLAGNTVAQKMYNITIDGVDFGELTEVDTEKLIGIIKGFQSGQTNITTQNLAPQKKSEKSEPNDKFPDLGTPDEIIGCVTVYGTSVRYWENKKTNFYLPKEKMDNMKYAIKTSLKEAGAVWNKDNGTYSFKTKKACNEWLKAQKARQPKK